MSDFLRRYLLSTAMRFAPPDPPNGGGSDPDDRIPEPDLDDDETVTDPIDETDPEPDSEEDEDEDEEADDQTDPAGGAPPERQSRGNRQFAELRRTSRETARQNAELTRQLAEIRGEMAALRAPREVTETPAQRAERLALLTPEERIQETVSETLRAHEQRSMQLQNQLMDQADRSTFEARAAANPLLKKLAPEVERRLQDLRSKGQNLPRDVVATYLIGEKVMAQQGKTKPGVKERRRQQETRPMRSQGDVGGGRQRQRAGGDSVTDIESRFGDVPI